MMARFKEEERRKLGVQIEEWNATRLDMFTLSQPDEHLEFFGVMRFFFQDDSKISTKDSKVSTKDFKVPTRDSKVSTKCVRVASTATSHDVIGALIEKFRPDMKMLADHDYALFEVHDGEERKMLGGERPLLVQLNWTPAEEGRFVLRELSATQLTTRLSSSVGDLREEGMERKLSRRQRRQLKKQRRQEQKLHEQQQREEPQEVSSFMRSLSNPELVLRRRRQVKLEKKLKHIHSSQNGGTLKIYGYSLKPDVPYKTLLLSAEDKVEEVVLEALEKYGLEEQEADKFCLVQVMVPAGGDEDEGGVEERVEERVMDDDECPLAILMQHPESLGTMKFHLRQRPLNTPKKKTPQLNNSFDYRSSYNQNYNASGSSNTPFLLPIRSDGSDRADELRCFIGPGRTAVGSEKGPSGRQFYQLASSDVFPEHCEIVRDGEGRVWVEGRMGEVVVEGQRCFQPTPLHHECLVQIGNSHLFRFIDPSILNNNYLTNNSGFPNNAQQNNAFPNNTFPHNVPSNHYNNNLNNRLQHSPSNSSICTKDLETTFDLEGHVITAPSHALLQTPAIHPANHPHPSNTAPLHNPMDKLPAMFFVNEQGEDMWLEECTNRLNFASLHFKVAPSLLFYLATRSRLPHMPAIQRLSCKIASRVATLVKDNPSNPPLLSFWLANCSELFHFYHADTTLSHPTHPASATLLQVVQGAFGSFLECLQVEMELTLPSFANPLPITTNLEEDFLNRRVSPTLANLLHVLTLAMSVLRRCRVNAGITIQIFSQLFKFANAWLFNCIVLDSHIGLCSREWGAVVRDRVGKVVAWAEGQGLELAAQCHFAKSVQLCLLLESPKSSLPHLASTFPLLNPLQIHTALHHFQPPLSPALLPNLPSTDGELEESLEACPSLVLPDDGFCCDSLQGVPQAFVAFAEAFEQAGLGRLVINPDAIGSWNVYMNEDEEQAAPLNISLRKLNKSLGVSIVSAKAAEEMERGIYVKSVVSGGAAQLDGRLEPGDQLLSVGGWSLVGMSQERAAEMMAGMGEVVDLMVLKQGALHNSLPSLMLPSEQHPPTQGTSNQSAYQQLPIKQASVQKLPYENQPSTQSPYHPATFQIHNSKLPPSQSPQLQSPRHSLEQISQQQQLQSQQLYQPPLQKPQQPPNQPPQLQESQRLQQPPQQPPFRNSLQARIETDSFQPANLASIQPSQFTQPILNPATNPATNPPHFPNQLSFNPSIQNPSIHTHPPSQHSSALLSNLKLTRPLSSLSSKKPGYASQMLFPKTQPPSIPTNNNINNDINNNSLKTNVSHNNNPPLIQASTTLQHNIGDSTYPPFHLSPPLPSPTKTPYFQHPPTHLQGNQDFPPPPVHLQIANLKIDLENNHNVPQIPPALTQPLPPTLLPTIPPSMPPSMQPTQPPPVPAKPKISKSPWEREAVEREEEEERKGRQVQEMLSLQAKEGRTYEEEQRLRRLQTEEAFDRRAMQEQLSSQSTPLLTPGTMKKSVTFSEHVGVNEYHRSFSSTSSDPPHSPSSHLAPSSITQPSNIYQFTKPSSNLTDQPPTYPPNQPPIHSSIQQPTQQLNQAPINLHNQPSSYQPNRLPTNQINQPPSNPYSFSTQSPNYQPTYPSQPTAHLFDNSVFQSPHVPPNIIKEPTAESQQRDFVRLAKIDHGPLYETPVNYQIKARISPTTQPNQQIQQTRVKPSYQSQQPTYNHQQPVYQYQPQPTYQQPSYNSLQHEPTYQQQQPILQATFQQQQSNQFSQPGNQYRQQERIPQQSKNINLTTHPYQSVSQTIETYPRQYQRNQNYIDYNYE